RRSARSARPETGSSEADQRRLDFALAPAVIQRPADRQVLDGESGGVEERDLVGRAAAQGLAHQDVAQLSHPIPLDQPGIHSIGQLAARARLLPLVAEEPAALDRLKVDL